ncbi:MAG: hypothetical protein JW818_18660 [Pirellulales bacterium]|nr:hypothetical protein [Pirellulales bacterium]
MRIGQLLSSLLPPASVGVGGCGGSRASEEPTGIDTNDTVEISPEGEAQAAKEAAGQTEADSEEAEPGQLTDEQRREVQKLQTQDRAVRAHEQAHLSVAGRYASGGPHFEYQTGPDGRRYAVGGEVSIDSSPEDDPEATIRKAQVIRAAALAPADPSAQDQRVAAKATKMEADARAELRQAEQNPEQALSGQTDPAAGESNILRPFLADAGFLRLGARFDAVA